MRCAMGGNAMNQLIRVGTRGSKLALAQTDIIVNRLKACHPGLEFEIVEINTTGDKFQNVSLDQIGGKGVFIKEIEEALLAGQIDMAVHSLKDMPALIHEDLVLAAFYERENPSDVLVSRNGGNLSGLPLGAVVGTSSLRRAYQLRETRPDLRIEPLRGNVNTRLRKLSEGQYDAIMLAAAGLIRLGLVDQITEWLPTDRFIPSVGQGIIAVETTKARQEIIGFLEACDAADSRIAALCERAFLRKLNGNCKIPVGAYCMVEENRIKLWGMLGDPDSTSVYWETGEGTAEGAEALGNALAERILEKMGSKPLKADEVQNAR